MQTLDVLSGSDYLMLSGKWNNGDGGILRSYLSQPLPIGLECVCDEEYYFILDKCNIGYACRLPYTSNFLSYNGLTCKVEDLRAILEGML
jgi:hypothetical protein